MPLRSSLPVYLSAGIALCAAGPALAQRWIIDPSIEAQATLTNNANYDTGAQREADLVFNLLPAVAFSREGPRLRLNGAASLNLIGYADGTQSSRVLPQANVLANLEAIDNLFYLEAALLANQEVLNPFLPESDDASTFNKYTYVQSRLSPYFQGRIGNDWNYLVRSDNSYTQTTQTDAALDNSYYGRHAAELARTATPVGGSLRAQREVTRFSDQGGLDQQLDVALATVHYAFNPQFTAGLRGGYERTNYTAEEESGPIYGAELAWSPSPLTRLAGFWENRFFGPGYQFSFSNRQRRLATSVSASRSVATYPQLVLRLPATGSVSNLLNAILIARFPDPIERAQQVQDLIDRQSLPASLPGSVNIFSRSANVVTEGGGSIALIGVRNTLALTLFYLKTDQLPDAAVPTTFVIFNNNTQRGASLSLTHRLTSLTSLNAAASRRETRGFDSTAGQSTDQNTFTVQLSRQLSLRSSVFVGARYQQQNSTSLFFGDSNEAAIFVGLFHRL